MGRVWGFRGESGGVFLDFWRGRSAKSVESLLVVSGQGNGPRCGPCRDLPGCYAGGGPGRERFGGECGVSVGKAGELFWIFGGGAAPKVSSRCWLSVVRERVRGADPTGISLCTGPLRGGRAGEGALAWGFPDSPVGVGEVFLDFGQGRSAKKVVGLRDAQCAERMRNLGKGSRCGE